MNANSRLSVLDWKLLFSFALETSYLFERIVEKRSTKQFEYEYIECITHIQIPQQFRAL